VPAGHWARDAIAELTAAGVSKGLGDGRFGPDDTVTREQFAKLLVLALGLPLSNAPEAPPFPDVPVDRWSSGYIVAAQSVLPGHPDGRFHPDQPALRAEIGVALAQAKGLSPAPSDLFIYFSDSDQISNSARPWIAAARAAGLIGGFPDRTFRPAAAVTRAQVAVLLQRARQICGNPPHSGCAAPLGPEDRTLLGAGLVSPMNAYTRSYRGGQVEVTYVTPVQQVWSVLVQGEGATPRGVAIGDSAATVRRAYGPQVELRNGALTYSAGAAYDYFYIRFAIVEGKVHSILLSQSK